MAMIRQSVWDGVFNWLAPLAMMLVASIRGLIQDAVGQDASGADAPAATITMQQALVIEPVGVSARSAIHTDAIERLIVEGRWAPPAAGTTVEKPDGSSVAWKSQAVDESGWLAHLGYVSWSVPLAEDAILMLDASGHSFVYVNGDLRPGDPYQYGNLSLPVSLRAGENELLFYCSRGRMRASLSRPKGEVFFDLRDMTLPDVLRGDLEFAGRPPYGGAVIVNTTKEAWSGEATVRLDVEASLVNEVGPIPPLSIRKVALKFPLPASLEGRETLEYEVSLSSGGGDSPAASHDPATITLNCRDAGDHHLRTFVSEIDGSVQMFSVRPSTTAGAGQALFLSLHGASVHAPSQSGSYGAKDWGHVVAPTNRRPFGFDWEDWGRIDAIEVLEEASRIYEPDPRRIYLTGHSMGGHGTWQLGAQFPDRFAAIGPSAGWVSFWSYAGAGEFGEATAVGRIMRRATLPSDTLALSRNFLQHGVYILHGDADDNVPVEQARQMRAHLGGYHPDFAYYERPGAGHWWGGECVDWPPMFDFFQRHIRPETSPSHVEFVTANPSISSRCQWVTIRQQEQSLELSKVVLDVDAAERRIVGTTENVRHLQMDLFALGGLMLPQGSDSANIRIVLDGSEIEYDLRPSRLPHLNLVRTSGGWSLPAPTEVAANVKAPERAGPFKEAFRNRMVFVYGTSGTAEENAWSLAKARSDAEMFFYRGNGSVDVIADTELFDFDRSPSCNVLLYGNADTNSAWPNVLGESPIQVHRGKIVCGDRMIEGNDLACLLTYPSALDLNSLAAAVCGTGPAGSRLTDRFTYFVSGVHYPDWYIARPETLTSGLEGVVGAGFFDHAWQLDPESSGWAE